MTIIGKYNLISAHRLLIPENEVAKIDIGSEAGPLSIIFVTLDDPDSKLPAAFMESTDLGATLTLTNWNSSLGQALVEPMRIGTFGNGKTMFAFFVTYTIGLTKVLDFQIMELINEKINP